MEHFGSDVVYCTGEQWDQYEESFERDEDDVQTNDDEEVQSLIECGSVLTSEPDVDPSTTARATRRALPKRSTAA